MERIKLVNMLIISFSVSGTAPQGSQASGAGRVGRKEVWNWERKAQGSQPGAAQQCSQLGSSKSALAEPQEGRGIVAESASSAVLRGLRWGWGQGLRKF